MKVVIDCNVIIAAALKNGFCRTVLKDVIAHHTLVASEEIFLEYLQVSSRAKFKASFETLQEIIITLAEIALVVKPPRCTYGLPDPGDNKYLDVALTAQAETLITGNIRDFPNDFYERTRIATPRHYLAMFLETPTLQSNNLR